MKRLKEYICMYVYTNNDNTRTLSMYITALTHTVPDICVAINQPRIQNKTGPIIL